MTITEATHALARQARPQRSPERAAARSEGPVLLVDAIARVEPTWVEAVAVVQAVCEQLAPGHAAPALDAITLSPSGAVSFPPTGAADDTTTVRAIGNLLSGILRTGDCPLPVWEASERARRSPASVGTPRAFGAAITCFPATQSPRELQQYFDACRKAGHRPPSSRLAALTAHLGFAVLLVALCGIGAGVSVGTLVATRTFGAPAPSVVTMAANQFVRP